jgi:NADH dehydrogenase
VLALTNRAPGTSSIQAAPLDFRDPRALAESMRGATVLYNTYWIRFAYGGVSHERAVENSRILVQAAEQAGVKRIVHLSVTNPSTDSPLSYFRGKAAVEGIIRSSSLSYAIVRPALIFGREDILINNIAWLLRRFPLFAIPGDGEYGLQPIFIEDLAAFAVETGHSRENMVVDAVGPETYTYKELVQLVREAIQSRSRVFCAPPSLVWLASRLVGFLVHDVLLNREEMSGLMANLLISNQPPAGTTSLREWLRENAGTAGVTYASEIERHYGRV